MLFNANGDCGLTSAMNFQPISLGTGITGIFTQTVEIVSQSPHDSRERSHGSEENPILKEENRIIATGS